MPWYITVLSSVGTSVVTCALMEAYYQRRAGEEVGAYDREDSSHRAG